MCAKQPHHTTIIIGVDPGTRLTGYGIIALSQNELRPLDFGCIRPPPRAPLSERYRIIHNGLEQLIERYTSHEMEMALETPYVDKNPQSALKLGIALGMALIAAKKRGMKIYGYSPREVKCFVVGTGKASKEQVQSSVRLLLSLSQPPKPQDAADALAIALCHAQSRQHCMNRAEKKEL